MEQVLTDGKQDRRYGVVKQQEYDRRRHGRRYDVTLRGHRGRNSARACEGPCPSPGPFRRIPEGDRNVLPEKAS